MGVIAGQDDMSRWLEDKSGRDAIAILLAKHRLYVHAVLQSIESDPIDTQFKIKKLF